MIARFEDLAPQVWPTGETKPLDGWQLGFSEGCTKRANSVRCLKSGPTEVQARIAGCEAHYRERGLATIFKLTQASRPEGLDRLLEARGYQRVDPTSVQRCDGSTAVPAADDWAASMRLERSCSDSFFAACAQLNHTPVAMQAPLRGILDRITHRCDAARFASVSVAGESVAQGIGVLYGGAVCLCEIVTRPDQRRRGLASSVVRALCGWARSRDALPWLQVVAANMGARSLYEELGFREMYQYWYRVRR